MSEELRLFISVGQNAPLIWEPIHANVSAYLVKTTIEIADDLFERVQQMARKEKTTFSALAERGLRMILKEKQSNKPKKLPPLITVGGGGLTDEFKNASWEKIRDTIYKGHGA